MTINQLASKNTRDLNRAHRMITDRMWQDNRRNSVHVRILSDGNIWAFARGRDNAEHALSLIERRLNDIEAAQPASRAASYCPRCDDDTRGPRCKRMRRGKLCGCKTHFYR